MKSRIAYIDGLRAVAVLLVVLDHAMQHGLSRGAGPAESLLRRIFAEGSHGVDLFFVLSGFCLSYPVLSALRRDGRVRFDALGYFAKRLVRIVPPYYSALGMLAAAPLAFALLHRNLPAGVAGSAGALDIFKQALFLDRNTTFTNGSFWTLCVEFRWYFFFPFALLLWVRNPRAFLAAVCALTGLFWFTRLHNVDLGTLLPFALGIIAADLSMNRLDYHRYVKFVIPVGILLAIMLENVTSMPTQFGIEKSSAFVQTNAGWQIAMFGLVLASGASNILRKVLSSRLLAGIGVTSYSIYLVHEPLVALVDGTTHGIFAQCALSLVAAIAGGSVFWVIFERPWTACTLKGWGVRTASRALAPIFRRLRLPVHTMLSRDAELPAASRSEIVGAA